MGQLERDGAGLTRPFTFLPTSSYAGFHLAPQAQVFAGGESGGVKIGRFGAGWVEEEPHWLGGSNGMKEAPRAREGILQSFVPQGAGHMVPTDKPQAALTMFSRFLNKQPY